MAETEHNKLLHTSVTIYVERFYVFRIQVFIPRVFVVPFHECRIASRWNLDECRVHRSRVTWCM